MAKHYDFGGYATKFNVRCSDGRTIRHSAFDSQLPCTVPLVWSHQHTSPESVIGHADLEARNDGVYCYCSFNDDEEATPLARYARAAVRHGDIDSLSIYANGLVERGHEVMHGSIKEVSLVLAGANPSAKIHQLDISHGSDGEYSAIIYPGSDEDFIANDYFMHSDDEEEDTKKMDNKEKSVGDVLETLNEEQQAAVVYVMKELKAKLTAGNNKSDDNKEETKEGGSMKHADEDSAAPKSGETVGDVLETLNEKQKAAVMYFVTEMKKKLESNKEETEMKHNAFESAGYAAIGNGPELSHSDESNIWKNFMSGRYQSFKQAILDYAGNNNFIAHADIVDTSTSGAEYGFEDIEWLFPDAKVISNEPMKIDRRQEWVSAFMDKTTKQPFSRIKSIYADLTADDARAKGYAKKAHLKTEMVVKLLKKVTHPTTVYIKAKFDKDDLRDINSFDPLKWIDGEMTSKMHEELARAALIGDGRDDSDPDKIDPDCIVPIINANKLFTIVYKINVANNATDEDIALAALDAAIKARKDYKGSGNTTLFTTEDRRSDLSLVKDQDDANRRLFATDSDICRYMRTEGGIQTVEFLEGQTLTCEDGVSREIFGIIVNPKDYAFGADKGGAIETFKQFDIDYNQEKILKETRCSGNLIKPYSAIVLVINRASA